MRNATRWVHTCDIKTVLDKHVDTEDIEKVGKDLAQVLRADLLLKKTDFADQFEECLTVDEIDDVLESLYDYADSERIWLGP